MTTTLHIFLFPARAKTNELLNKKLSHPLFQNGGDSQINIQESYPNKSKKIYTFKQFNVSFLIICLLICPKKQVKNTNWGNWSCYDNYNKKKKAHSFQELL